VSANDNQIQVVLAAGGTGGHLFPAEALAGVLLRRGCKVDLITDQRGDAFSERLPQVTVHQVTSGGVAGMGALAKAKGAFRLLRGLMQCRALIKRLDPHVAVGFGGYPSIPPILAAQQFEIRTVLHEQNAVAGRANRFLAKRASKIALSFEKVRMLEKVPASKLAFTGNPVRPAITRIGELPYRAPCSGEDIRLLVFGGSQGARAFSEQIPAAITLLAADLRQRLRIVQQCRAEDLERAATVYRNAGLEVELKPFFDDMPARLSAAHLVICRAGASSVAELTAAGRPGLLVPLPNSIDDHQIANARAIEERGGGWVLLQTNFAPASIAERLTTIFGQPEKLEQVAEIARGLGKRDAAERLADVVTDLLPARYQPEARREIA
jgi:UDP-N-acetylglucosamine--N-acetylmuramyl-(pentapeptide) pyrophosphoryl-undecaprenol N-acetylglucosamine transferase